MRSRIELSKNFSIVSTENIPLASQTATAEQLHYPYVLCSLSLSLSLSLPLSQPVPLTAVLFFPQTHSEGHIQGRIQEDRVLIYMGIIDILQSYRLKKKLEHTMKAVFADGVRLTHCQWTLSYICFPLSSAFAIVVQSTVSVHNPTFYARRFQDFMTQQLFRREKGKEEQCVEITTRLTFFSLTVKYRTRKNSANVQMRGRRPGGGAGGHARVGGAQLARQNSREARLSPLHESATHVGGARRALGKPVAQRGRSASEYIPRSKAKDHLPEIPAMNFKPSERAASTSGKGSSEMEQRSPTADQRSPTADQSAAVVSDEQISGTEDMLEASTDFARNVRGTSTPIDVSPDGTKRSETFNTDHIPVIALNTSDANDRKPRDADKTTDTVDTQQIELSVVDRDCDSGEHSHSLSAGDSEAGKHLSLEAQS